MARSASSIQAEITALESMLSSSQSMYESVSADGVARSINRSALEQRIDRLYQQLGRANGTAPMFPRGHVTGLGR